MAKIYFSLFMLLAVCLSSCSKGGGSGSGEKIGIYRIKSNQTLPMFCKIDSANLALNDNALITNNEIVSYDQRNFEFKIENAAATKLKDVRDNETLAIVVGGQVIYYCLNKPLYSSSICPNNISMQHISNTLNMAIVTLQGSQSIPDPRNDMRLINALRSQRKLK